MSATSDLMNGIVDNVEKVIIGKRESVELVVLAMMCSGHILIEDVPGVGKTTMVSALARSVNAAFKRIQFTPDIMPSDITGFSMYNPRSNEFEYQKGCVFSNLVLADEINRTPPKTQASLLEVMEERQVSVDGVTYLLPKFFMVLATQNPIEYIGTYPLPEAQLDRFIMKISIGYPDNASECSMIDRMEVTNPLMDILPVSSVEEILNVQEEIKKIYVDSSIKRYVVALADATRKNPSLLLGASPRAVLNIITVAKAHACYKERNFVIPDDIQKMLPHVWSHRLILTQDSKMKGYRTGKVLASILQTVKVPVVD
jgi:MoxR-like ATPase